MMSCTSLLELHTVATSKFSSIITRCNINTHITALKAFKNFLFVAEGNQVSVYSLIENKFITSAIVFSSSSIHGIRTDIIGNVLFFGSKSLKLFLFSEGSPKCLKNITEEILLPDWIHDAKLLKCSSLCTEVAVVLAHNSMFLLDINNNLCTWEIQCLEKCIVYTANIISTIEDAILVAVGTVFKQILLWSPNTSFDKKFSEVLHCLEGHQGVIFSISFNKEKRLLGSTSDDRSIRLWKIEVEPQYVEFSLEFWKMADIQTIHVLFGHESRVWSSVILQDCVISVGEDSHICFWDKNGELLKKNKCHKNGSIWCLEAAEITFEDGSISAIVITGGSDGGIYFWEVLCAIKNSLSQISLCDHQNSLISSESSSEISTTHKKDFPRVVFVILLNENKYLLTMTDKGLLTIYDMIKKSWKNVFYEESFASYCISSVSYDNRFIALGNIMGSLVILDLNECSFESCIVKKTVHSSKVCSVLWVDKKGEYILTCGMEGEMSLWGNATMKENALTRNKQLYLPKCKPHWWCTCAAYVSSTKNLIVGDRGGSVSLYSFDTVQNSCEVAKPNAVLKCIHGTNGVTDVQEHRSVIYSAGRDGRVLLYNLEEKSLILLHVLKIPPNLEWIGKMLFHGTDLLLLGFHTKYFMVWSHNLERSVMMVECGGGHRSWDFQITSSGLATFAAIKKKDIIFLEENLSFILTKSVLKNGISGREFCKACYLFNSNYVSNSIDVLAVGGEDNTLRIVGFITDDSNQTQCVTLNSLSGHLSSIRSIAKASMAKKNTFILATVGGRAQMILWKIKNGKFITYEQLGSYILSSEKKVKKPWKSNLSTQVDPQTRLMDVCVVENTTDSICSEHFTIAVACSDSFLRIYKFDVAKKHLSLSHNLSIGDNCILKSCFFQVPKIHNSGILAATTDGKLSFLLFRSSGVNYEMPENEFQSINQDLVTCLKIQLHQSGINALDIKCISDSKWLICSGGDDNAISAILVQNKSEPSESGFDIINRANVINAHASQITGLKVLGSKVVSASIDQRINIWNLDITSNSISLTLIASSLTFIPDIADLECWRNRENQWKVVVCGEGMEVLILKE